MESLLSIIIPVYNVQDYIDECMKSILGQITDACEIILIDDGSTDKSAEKCDSYESERIIVIHKQNGGLSSARNAGLAIAKGKYIAFIDSDDRIANGSISRIMKWINNHDADMCFLDAIKFFPDNTIMPLGDEIQKECVENRRDIEVLCHLSTRPKFPGSSCTKIYSRKFLEEKQIFFPNNRRTSEDLWFVIECLINAKTFGLIEGPYYEYRQKREGSITNTMSENNVESLMLFVEHYCDCFCIDKKPKNQKYEYAMSFIAYEYVQLIVDYAWFRNIDESLRERIVLYKWTLKYGASKRLRVISLLSTVFGIRFTSKLLLFYLNHR